MYRSLSRDLSDLLPLPLGAVTAVPSLTTLTMTIPSSDLRSPSMMSYSPPGLTLVEFCPRADNIDVSSLRLRLRKHILATHTSLLSSFVLSYPIPALLNNRGKEEDPPDSDDDNDDRQRASPSVRAGRRETRGGHSNNGSSSGQERNVFYILRT